MPPTTLFTLSLTVTLAAGIGVGLMRRFALRRAILDIPNERSSHVSPRWGVYPECAKDGVRFPGVTPTPRGGGYDLYLDIFLVQG